MNERLSFVVSVGAVDYKWTVRNDSKSRTLINREQSYPSNQ